MPEPMHPPYADTAKFQTRRLQRWLDINPQNGPLTRTSKYLVIPAFSQAVTWLGYSDIVASFNYEGPNSFSLKQNYILDSAANYSLAIMWVDVDNNVNRWFLSVSPNAVFYFQPIMYNGEVIKNNFRFEIWSTNSSPAVNTSDITIYTSVLSDIDYRYGTDSSLKNADAEVTNFQNINNFTDTLPAELNQIVNWNPTGMVQGVGNSLTAWHDSLLNDNLVPTGLVACLPATGLYKVFNNAYVPNVGGALLSFDLSSLATTFNYVAMVVKFQDVASGDVFYLDNGGAILQYDTGTQTISNENGAIVHNIQLNVWYVVIITDGGSLIVYDLLSATLFGSSFGAFSQGNASHVIVGACIILDLVMGTGFGTADGSDQIARYYASKYSDSYSLPLTFPTNSVPQTN